jgi:hypothetical protein
MCGRLAFGARALRELFFAARVPPFVSGSGRAVGLQATGAAAVKTPILRRRRTRMRFHAMSLTAPSRCVVQARHRMWSARAVRERSEKRSRHGALLELCSERDSGGIARARPTQRVPGTVIPLPPCSGARARQKGPRDGSGVLSGHRTYGPRARLSRSWVVFAALLPSPPEGGGEGGGGAREIGTASVNSARWPDRGPPGPRPVLARRPTGSNNFSGELHGHPTTVTSPAAVQVVSRGHPSRRYFAMALGSIQKTSQW